MLHDLLPARSCPITPWHELCTALLRHAGSVGGPTQSKPARGLAYSPKFHYCADSRSVSGGCVTSIATSALYVRKGNRAAARAGSSMARLASVLIVAPILVVGAASDAQSPSCGCSRTNPVDLASGGDSKPLTWIFWAVQKSAGGPHQPRTICYARIVENKSVDEIDDVFWKVAGYSKDYIARKSALPSCTDFPGEVKATPDQGPLHYGPAAFQAYDTTVWPPVSGWIEKQASTEDLRLSL
jgi:hypothetical protein